MGLARKLVILGALLAQACSVEQPVSGPVALTGEWTTIEPPAPLRIAGNEQQKVCLHIVTIHDTDFKNVVVLDNGQRHTLEGEAVDSKGGNYALKIGDLGGRDVCLYRAGEHPPGPDFSAGLIKLRLRSVPPLQVAAIRWYSYDQM